MADTLERKTAFPFKTLAGCHRAFEMVLITFGYSLCRLVSAVDLPNAACMVLTTSFGTSR